MVEVTRVDGFLVNHANAPGGKQFRFSSEQLRRFSGYLNRLERTYDSDLLDPESVIREELKLTKLGGYATPHVIVVAEEEKPEAEKLPRDVVGAASGNMMPVKFGDEPTDRAAFGILSYSAPEVAGINNPTYRAVERLTSELEAIARKRGRPYFGDVVESEPGKVDIYRSWGFQRLDGVPYVQPVLDWKRDGTPAKKEVELPLMYHKFSKYSGSLLHPADLNLLRWLRGQPDTDNTIFRNFALEVVNALYDWTVPSQDEFPQLRDGRAERNAVQYHETMRDRILDAIVKPGNEVRLV